MAWQACYALITTALITESTRPRHTPSLGFKHNIVRRPLRPLTATTLTTAPSSKTEILVDDSNFRRPAVDSRQYRLLKLASSTKISVFDDGAVVSVVAVNGLRGRLTMLCLKPREGVCRGRVDSVMSAVATSA